MLRRFAGPVYGLVCLHSSWHLSWKLEIPLAYLVVRNAARVARPGGGKVFLVKCILNRDKCPSI
jgi:hypothetical protein